mgnify:CR=1 FL=1
MADLKKKFIDILFEDDPEDKEISEKLLNNKNNKKDQLSAKDVLYHKNNSSAFINLYEDTKKEISEIEKEKEAFKEEYEMSSQISPIFGMLKDGEPKAVTKNDSLKTQNKKDNSVLDIVASPIYGNQFDEEDEINKDETDTEEQQTEENPPATQVDTTTSISRQLLRHTRAILKRMTKDRAQHKCELEVLNTCKYFTSKEDNNNYLEIHHLIPWAFSNDFENSLEHIDNYVALCPSCHMLLHHGTDRERKQALTYLFNQRKDKLKSAGLEITLERLFEYYQIEA